MGRRQERDGGREERSHRGGKFVSKGVGGMLSVCAGARKGVAGSHADVSFPLYLERDLHFSRLQLFTSCVSLPERRGSSVSQNAYAMIASGKIASRVILLPLPPTRSPESRWQSCFFSRFH